MKDISHIRKKSWFFLLCFLFNFEREFPIVLSCFYTSCEGDTNSLFLDYLFKDVYIALEDRDHVSLQSVGQVCLLSIIKDSGPLRSGFISCNSTHCGYRCHLALFVALWGNCHKNADILATSVAVSSIVLCL